MNGHWSLTIFMVDVGVVWGNLTLCGSVVERRMRGVWPARSFICKYSLGARGQAAEERACIDRQMKVPTCLPTQMASHRTSMDDTDGS
ncbi:hypothetical protein Zmor_000518 [Zophobas morio]|uniref:Uncharacterized protein n=1 Tax=Zophobas morio TaxID=2755281 RepID=A0AA38IWL6_9CUCU|nr:hypothetical protein Zmor_000518 [Zophobas morio]